MAEKFCETTPVMLPINIMEIAIRPTSLCMRLFGNILGGFIIMKLVEFVVPAVIPAFLSLYFDSLMDLFRPMYCILDLIVYQ